jgi:hypothetical protein
MARLATNERAGGGRPSLVSRHQEGMHAAPAPPCAATRQIDRRTYNAGADRGIGDTMHGRRAPNGRWSCAYAHGVRPRVRAVPCRAVLCCAVLLARSLGALAGFNVFQGRTRHRLVSSGDWSALRTFTVATVVHSCPCGDLKARHPPISGTKGTVSTCESTFSRPATLFLFWHMFLLHQRTSNDIVKRFCFCAGAKQSGAHGTG